ncbi:hypothetical protein GWK75_02065 [Candidatus Saccharibacteria bacterium oral taxon 955]|nr:hypothetical protein GWK75_02065 [Candidatus Saccharibacteria bacterium oral taxon 955]
MKLFGHPFSYSSGQFYYSNIKCKKMQYSDKTKEKCPDLTYSWCVDLGWGRLAVFVLPFVRKTSAQKCIALEVITVLTAGATGVSETVSTLRSKAQLFQATLPGVT